MGGNIISHGSAYSDLHVDNLIIAFTGSHGIGMGTKANLKVTNCEIGFIGGSAQNYSTGKITRYGNGIEIWGNVMPRHGSTVTDGFVIDNCYVYQCTTTRKCIVSNISNRIWNGYACQSTTTIKCIVSDRSNRIWNV